MPVTPNLHLELFAPLGVGWREDATAGALLDYNMMLLDSAVGGGGTSVLLQLNGVDLGVQNKLNFADDGILQIIEGASGELSWDSSGVIATANTYASGLVTAEATARATADAALAPKTRTISTTAPLTGGGDLSANRTLAISNFTGDSGTGGASGAVPAPSSGDAAANKYLKANGSWVALAFTDFASGQLGLARGGTNVDLSVTGGTTNILAQDASHVISARDLVAGDIPSLSASKITSGLLALGVGGTGVDLSATGAATFVLAQDASHVISARALVAGDIPSLSAAKITSGLLALGVGGTGVDLSATGGTTKIIAQDASHVISARDLVAGDIPSLSAAKITSGLLALGVGGTGVDLSATGGTTFVLAQDASHVISARALVAADIPLLSAAKITSGVLALAQGGNTFALLGDLIYGGVAAAPTVLSGQITTTKKYLSQTGSGAASAAPVWAQINYADLAGTTPTPPSGAVLWNALGNAGGALTLANGTNATTFNHTSAVVWTWANTTAATSGGTVTASPVISLSGRLFNSGTDTAALWALQNIVSTALTFTPTLISESASNVVTLTIGTHTLVAGNWVTFTGLTTGSWLNAQNARITSVTATTILFTDPTSHGTQSGAGTTGTVTQIPINEMTFTPTGSAGEACLNLPVGGGFGNLNPGHGGLRFAGMVAFTGFNAISSAGGLAVYTGGAAASVPCFGMYNRAAGLAVRVGILEFGDNSPGNSAVSYNAEGTNFSVALKGNNTTNVTNPAVMLGNANSLTATANNQIGVGVGYSKGSSVAHVFAPTSGTATFQSLVNKYSVNQTGGANGNVTGLLISAVETAVGGTHLMLDLQAGAAGTTSVLAINSAGVATKYASSALVSQGIASEIATIDLTAQSAAIAATNLIASAPRSGMYRISWSATITTVDGSASVLGGANGFQIIYTSPTDSVVKTTVPGASITSAGNTTGTAVGGTIVVYAKTGTAIQYQYGYTSTTPGQMVYELHQKLEAL